MTENTKSSPADIVPPTPRADQAPSDSNAANELTLAQRRDEDLDDGNADDVILANPQWGAVSMLAAIQSLGGIIPGAGIIEAAFSNTFRTVEMHGEFSISNGGGSLEEYFLEQDGIVDSQGRKKDDDDDGGWDRYIEIAEQRAEQREMEEWQREVHSFAGQNWTGKQWGEVADELKEGGAGHDWLVSYLMNKKHESKEQAEQLANDMALAASGREKPEAYRTQAEKDAGERVSGNPDAADAFSHQEEARMSGFKPVAAETRAVTSAGQKASVSSGSDGMYEDFPSAPNLTEHHQAAMSATEPLDAKPAPAPAPAPVAAITHQPKPGVGAGLDV